MPIENAQQPFAVRAERYDDMIVLEFQGELDLAAREQAATALADAVSDAPHVIVVNLRGLSFMDSTGIQCLLEAKMLADASGARMAILNGSGPPHRVLELTGMDDLVEMVDDPPPLDPPPVDSR